MTNTEILEHVYLLREKANNNKLIVFVGAGVSCNVAGFPDWNSLINKMASAINYSRCSFCREKTADCANTCKVRERYSTDESLKIPQYVFNENPDIYKQVLKDNIKNVDVDAPLSNAILEIGPKHIITTNYDNLIESCKSAKEGNFAVIVNDKDLLQTDKSKYIIKMHGDIEQQETIVLKESDYLEYSQNHVLIEMFVKALLTDHTMLFLGYSLNDYNIKLIVSWINYIRNQNKAIDEDTKIAYIVVDNPEMSDVERKYFAHNNIGVINLNKMPVVAHMPEMLTNEIGQRLYSFLKTISDFSWERNLGQKLVYQKAVSFMKEYSYIDCRNFCKLLCLGRYDRNGEELMLFSDIGYDSLVECLKTGNEEGKYIEQVLNNIGVKNIELVSGSTARRDNYIIQEKEKFLLKNKYYQTYLLNQYSNLMEIDTEVDVFNSCFYKILIHGYSRDIYDEYTNQIFDNLSDERKVAYLFNVAALEAIRNYQYNEQPINRYISGITDKRKKDMVQFYLDIQEGNTDKILKMKKSLDKLKEQYSNPNCSFLGCSSLQEFNKIKAIAIEQYMFYFYNILFFERFSDLKRFLKLYTEAIICTNGKFEEKTESQTIGETTKRPYSVDRIDIDILTKHIPVKDFYNLILEYKVEYLKTDQEMEAHVVECFENIVDSVLDLKLYNSHVNSGHIVISYFILLSHISLSDENKIIVTEILKNVLSNDDFIDFFFSIDCPEWRLSLKILKQLLGKFPIYDGIKIVKKIILRDKFWEYLANVNIYDLAHVFDFLIQCDELECVQSDVQEVIERFEGKKKISLIQLLKNNMLEEYCVLYKRYISEHYEDLDTDNIFDFFYSEWLELSSDKVDSMIDKTLDMYQKRMQGCRVWPDPVEAKLELICLLYITGAIEDVKKLECLKEKNEFIQFFIEEDSFDFNKVDLSHYMWQNIARRPKFMEIFIRHKEAIIPKIQERIKLGCATEFERMVLYGCLLEKTELF